MKSFVAFAVLGFCAFAAAAPAMSDEQKAKARALVEACVKETKVDPSVPKMLKEGDFSTTDPNAAKFVYCFLRKANLIDSAGKQNIEMIKEKLLPHGDQAAIDEAISKCKDIEGDSPEQSAWLAYKCYRDQHKA